MKKTTKQTERDRLNSLEVETSISNIPLLDYLTVVITRKKHESGFRMLEVYGINHDQKYEKKLTGCCDVVEFDVKSTSSSYYQKIRVESGESGIIGYFSPGFQFKVVNLGSDFMVALVERKTKEMHNYERFMKII